MPANARMWVNGVSAGEATHGASYESRLAADRFDTNAFSEQRKHGRVALTRSYRPPIRSMGWIKGCQRLGVRTWLLGGGGRVDSRIVFSVGVGGQSC